MRAPYHDVRKQLAPATLTAGARPPAPVTVRYECPRCGGPHPKVDCPER